MNLEKILPMLTSKSISTCCFTHFYLFNGDLTKSCQIKKATRQGCPLSPILFILVLEVRIREIRQDKKILVLKIKKEMYKLRTFAD